MKIIRLSTFLDFGGVEKKMLNISQFNDPDNEWIFCAINKGGFAEQKIKENNKKAIVFNLSYSIPSLQSIKKLYYFFKKEKPDVVHTSGAEANFHGIIAAKIAGVPIKIAEEIGIPKQSFVAKQIFRVIYSMANNVVGESNAVVNYLHDNYHIPKNRLSKIHNFVLFSKINSEILNNDGIFKMISVSRLEAVKNIESVLRILPQLLRDNPNITYTVVGEGPHRKILERLVIDLALENHVFLVGFKSNPYDFLLNADLYLLTSFTEGFSNSLLEAMYCGIPCLSTKVGAAEEFFIDSKNGWIVNPDNEVELKEKLSSILKLDPLMLNNIGQAGKKTIEDKFSLSRHIKELFKIYEN